MTDQPETSSPSDEETKTKLDRRGVLREFVRTGKYAAPIATILLFGNKEAAAMMGSDV